LFVEHRAERGAGVGRVVADKETNHRSTACWSVAVTAWATGVSSPMTRTCGVILATSLLKGTADKTGAGCETCG